MTDCAGITARIDSLAEGIDDEIARMAMVVFGPHHSVERFHWPGFYCVTAPEMLTVGPKTADCPGRPDRAS